MMHPEVQKARQELQKLASQEDQLVRSFYTSAQKKCSCGKDPIYIDLHEKVPMCEDCGCQFSGLSLQKMKDYNSISAISTKQQRLKTFETNFKEYMSGTFKNEIKTLFLSHYISYLKTIKGHKENICKSPDFKTPQLNAALQFVRLSAPQLFPDYVNRSLAKVEEASRDFLRENVDNMNISSTNSKVISFKMQEMPKHAVFDELRNKIISVNMHSLYVHKTHSKNNPIEHGKGSYLRFVSKVGTFILDDTKIMKLQNENVTHFMDVPESTAFCFMQTDKKVALVLAKDNTIKIGQLEIETPVNFKSLSFYQDHLYGLTQEQGVYKFDKDFKANELFTKIGDIKLTECSDMQIDESGCFYITSKKMLMRYEPESKEYKVLYEVKEGKELKSVSVDKYRNVIITDIVDKLIIMIRQ